MKWELKVCVPERIACTKALRQKCACPTVEIARRLLCLDWSYRVEQLQNKPWALLAVGETGHHCRVFSRGLLSLKGSLRLLYWEQTVYLYSGNVLFHKTRYILKCFLFFQVLRNLNLIIYKWLFSFFACIIHNFICWFFW